MLNSWFSSKSSRHRKTPSNSPPPRDDVKLSPSDASSVSQSTLGPVQTPGNSTSAPDGVPLDEVHVHISDPSVFTPTPSLTHSTEKEAGTLRTSDALAGLDATQRVSEGTLFTPQDATIAQVFGKSVGQPTTDSAHVHATPPSRSNAVQPSVSLTTRTSDSVSSPPSTQPSHGARPGPTLTIYDPFSGAKLGEHTPISPSTATPREPSVSASVSTPLPTADDRKLWSSLEQILELQAEIAAMHADMEGVGRGHSSGANVHAGGITGGSESGNAGTRKRSLRRGQTLPVGDEEPEEHEPDGGTTGVAISEVSTEHSGGEDDDEDEDEDDVHGYGKRRRDEEFARLAEQFAQRKAAIGGVMNKLDALSTALKTFHTLPPPLFDLATSPSCTGTMSSAPSNISVISSPPPLSISPSQAGRPITPPTASPPVPPISTLAPPVPSGDLSAPSPPVPTPIVAPVLPQMALPTIIPGAPHVESPADMHHTQSIFQRVS